jgi:hypothetical protein
VNLEENVRRAIENGLLPQCMKREKRRCPLPVKSEPSESDIVSIRQSLKRYFRDLTRRYNVNPSAVHSIAENFF